MSQAGAPIFLNRERKTRPRNWREGMMPRPKRRPMCSLARIMLWKGKPSAAQLLVDDAWQLANVEHFQRYVVLARRMVGAVALANDDITKADQFLNCALVDARAMDLVVEEVLSLIELAELNMKRRSVASCLICWKTSGIWSIAARIRFLMRTRITSWRKSKGTKGIRWQRSTPRLKPTA